jgi:hypothetical protein
MLAPAAREVVALAPDKLPSVLGGTIVS